MNMSRVRALTILGTLVIAAVVLVVITLSKDQQTEVVAAEDCPVGYVPADLTLPDNNEDITIDILNATKTSNLANKVAADFKFRKFTVDKTGNSKTALPDEIAVLQYGPKAVGKAHVLRAYFLDNATTEFDIKREDDKVTVILGGRFRDLATPTEFNQAIGQLGFPVLPEGTCEQK